MSARAAALLRWGGATVGANATNEDRFRVSVKPGVTVAGVFDGHGGCGVSQFLNQVLVDRLASQVGVNLGTIIASFEAVDAELGELVFAKKNDGPLLQEGSCALAAIVTDSEIFVASTGDSQAFYVLAPNASMVSQLHTADCPEEQAKLRAAHPLEKDVVHCRQKIVELDEHGQILTTRWGACYVKGRLQPTRAFGDFYLKDIRAKTIDNKDMPLVPPQFTPPYITASPSITVIPRILGAVLVLASDGLWDYVSTEMATDLVREGLAKNWSPEQLANELIRSALLVAAESSGMKNIDELLAMPQNQERRNVHDDITVVVLIT